MPVYTKRQIEIIQAAIEIIGTQCIQGLTIASLAEKIGISEPGLYRHFNSKIEILEAVLGYFENENKKHFSEVKSTRISSIEKIRLIFQYYFKLFAHQPALAAIIFSEGIFQNDRRLTNKVNDIMALFHQNLIEIITYTDTDCAEQTLRKDVDSNHLATIVMGTLRLIVNKWHLFNHRFDLIQEGNNVLESLLRILVEPGKNDTV